MGSDVSGSSGRGFSRVFRALMLIVFVSLLLIGILASRGERENAATVTSPGNLRRVRLLGREKRASRWNSDLIYVSKRRVPGGPDPIHNRHIGETRRPSGRV